MIESSVLLSERLREDTREAHVRAERSGLMRRLMRGRVDRAEYVALLVALAAIYDALETQCERHAAHPALAPFALQPLRRHPALLADLAELTGPAATLPPPTDTARAYAAHLRALGDEDPTRLVAHAYVRYLGDLSGGRILRGIVERALGLQGGAGTTFYDFARAGDPATLKGHFRAALDALPPAAADPLVHEALVAFALHERLFTELDAIS